MNEGKTAAAIAAEIGVTRQTIYRRLKSSAIEDQVKAQSVKHGKEVLYTAEGERLIKSLFENGNDVTCNTTCNTSCDTLLHVESPENSEFYEERVTPDNVTCNTTCNTCDTSCNTLIDTLREQLRQKDAQISSLQMQNEQLTRTLESTVAALNAAQTLHAANIQRLMLDADEQANTTAEPDASTPERPPSLWERLRARLHRNDL